MEIPLKVQCFRSLMDMPSSVWMMVAVGLKEVAAISRHVYVSDDCLFYVCIGEDATKRVGDQVFGFCTVRDDQEGGKWIQAAWTAPDVRRRGVFAAIAQRIAVDFASQPIGLGTQEENAPMQEAAKRCGFEVKTIVYSRGAEKFQSPMIRPELLD